MGARRDSDGTPVSPPVPRPQGPVSPGVPMPLMQCTAKVRARPPRPRPRSGLRSAAQAPATHLAAVGLASPLPRLAFDCLREPSCGRLNSASIALPFCWAQCRGLPYRCQRPCCASAALRSPGWKGCWHRAAAAGFRQPRARTRTHTRARGGWAHRHRAYRDEIRRGGFERVEELAPSSAAARACRAPFLPADMQHSRAVELDLRTGGANFGLHRFPPLEGARSPGWGWAC